jgi:hypothetical protein
MAIGTALGWSVGATIALAVALAFFFGYLLTSKPLPILELHGDLHNRLDTLR